MHMAGSIIRCWEQVDCGKQSSRIGKRRKIGPRARHVQVDGTGGWYMGGGGKQLSGAPQRSASGALRLRRMHRSQRRSSSYCRGQAEANKTGPTCQCNALASELLAPWPPPCPPSPTHLLYRDPHIAARLPHVVGGRGAVDFERALQHLCQFRHHERLLAAVLRPAAAAAPGQLRGQLLALPHQHNQAPLAVLIRHECHALARRRGSRIGHRHKQVRPAGGSGASLGEQRGTSCPTNCRRGTPPCEPSTC